ncbi:single-stranded DNA-binding protein [Helicobacter brantae]|uniref:Single-stranded DNA-binding protein n=1 Tax=Helicobacter brantae TaxID=375927 RepID=A0A3D8J2V1_9HELI|nr:single-stranded DNA-binding protein [Helicobacter brantae]RDU71475.1 single-stranded DNA-binding protein [Helicobacter brantae]
MYNKVILVGNLTRDVELRYMPSGSAVATMGMATNRRYRKQDGSQGDDTCFIDVKLFGRTAEVANQYLRKGSKVLIEGKLTYETWSDQSGVKRSKHTVTAESMQMLDTRQEVGGYEAPMGEPYQAPQSYASQSQYTPQQSYQAPQQNTYAENHYQQNIPEINIDDEDIPF